MPKSDTTPWIQELPIQGNIVSNEDPNQPTGRWDTIEEAWKFVPHPPNNGQQRITELRDEAREVSRLKGHMTDKKTGERGMIIVSNESSTTISSKHLLRPQGTQALGSTSETTPFLRKNIASR